MKGNKILLVSLLAIFCLSIGAVCATDFDNDTVINEDQNLTNDNLSSSNQVELIDDNNLSSSNQELSDDDNLSNTNTNTVSDNSNFVDYVRVVDVFAAAPAFKKYVDTHGILPDTVRVGGKILPTTSYVNLMAEVVGYPKLKGTVLLVVRNSHIHENQIIECNHNFTKEQYIMIAKRVFRKLTHNVIDVKEGDERIYLSYDVYAYAFACILEKINHPRGVYPSQMLFTSLPFYDKGDARSDMNHDYDNYNSDDYSNYSKISDDSNNVKSGNLENTGNPLLLLIFTLTILPILRIKK